MKHTYKVDGMTCNNCKDSVEKYLGEVDDVTNVFVNLEKGEAEVTMDRLIDLEVFMNALPDKYKLTEQKEKNIFTPYFFSGIL